MRSAASWAARVDIWPRPIIRVARADEPTMRGDAHPEYHDRHEDLDQGKPGLASASLG